MKIFHQLLSTIAVVAMVTTPTLAVESENSTDVQDKDKDLRCSPSSSLTGFRPQNCAEIQKILNWLPSDHPTYKIYPSGPLGPAIDVQCDFTTLGGGWTIIQSRGPGGDQQEFYKGWLDYEAGFGCPSQNHWLGLKTISDLTHQHKHELYILLTDWDGITAFASYDHFFVSDSSDLYRLSVAGYSGNAGDSLLNLSGHQFSTKDRDNDVYEGSCAQLYHGAWWYTKCHSSNLNGLYRNQTETVPYADGIIWRTWKEYYYSLKMVQIKIRPKICPLSS